MSILETWSEGPGGMLASSDPASGGIIDRTILGNEWFVIFNRDSLDTLEGFTTRDDAVKAATEALA